MNRIDLANALAVVMAMAISLGGALALPRLNDTKALTPATSASPSSPQRYRRIVSASLVADGLLAELAEPGTVVATTRWLDGDHPQAFRFPGAARIVSLEDPEQVLALRPDLVLVAGSDPSHVARLREAGVEVRDLGGIQGVATLLPAIAAAADALGCPERGAALARRVRRALTPRASAGSPRAMYVGAVGEALWAGAADTSYHDILLAAGLRDGAAEAGLSGWPTVSIEQLVAIDPDFIVGEFGLQSTLCGRAALHDLTACRLSRVIEINGKILSDPGPVMIDAVEAVDAAWRQR
jgi:iron complex transport system substrate-binding protein